MQGAPFSRRAAARAASVSPPDLRSLRSSREFRHVLTNGRRRSAGGVTVVSLPAADTAVGLVAGARVGNAVVRNRAKRRLRAAIRQAGVPSGAHHVVIASSSTTSVPYDDLVSALERCFSERADR